MCHPDENTIFQYVSQKASEQEQLQVDTHIADCPECMERVRALLYIRKNFESVWTSWTSAEHGRVYRQWKLAKALKEAAERSPSMTVLLKQWLMELKNGMGIGINVLMGQAMKVASAAAATLPIGYEFELRPAYAGVGSPDEQTQLVDRLKKSSSLLSHNKIEEALSELAEAVKIDARSPQAAVSEICREGNRILQMIVDSRRGCVFVKFWQIYEKSRPALAVLLPNDSGKRVLISPFKQVENEQYILAEFDNLPDGVYSLQIGPHIKSN
jgi:hypothetical protein